MMGRRRLIGAGLLLLCTCAIASAADVRLPALAGKWYPAIKTRLLSTVESTYAHTSQEAFQSPVLAYLVPHAGYRFSGKVAGWAYRQIQPNGYDRIIILGPSHYAAFRGFSIAKARAWRTPLGDVPVDSEVCKALRRDRLHVAKESIHQREHSIEMQLPFLQSRLKKFTIVPILVGQLRTGDSAAIAKAIKPHLTKTTLIIVSSDLIHYGPRYKYVPFAKDKEQNIRKLDMAAISYLLRRDPGGFDKFCRAKSANICGRQSLSILLHLLPPGAGGKLLSYDTSGRMTRDFTNSVSYASIAFLERAPTEKADGNLLTEEEQKVLLRIARTTVNSFVKTKRAPTNFERIHKITPKLMEKRGVFVTIKRGKTVRGCIGRTAYPGMADSLPALYETVRLMAVHAAAKDSRFKPVSVHELDMTSIEISVLSAPKPIKSVEEIVVGRHGIIIAKGRKQATYLPHVAPGQGWDRATTLSQLCRKAGLPANAWKRSGMKFYIFTAQTFDEELVKRDRPVPPEMLR
jgi:MEMO1 family protein